MTRKNRRRTLAGAAAAAPAAPAASSRSLDSCVTSRLANGDPRLQAEANPALVQGAARMWCSYGPAFDSQTDPSVGLGPNTAG